MIQQCIVTEVLVVNKDCEYEIWERMGREESCVWYGNLPDQDEEIALEPFRGSVDELEVYLAQRGYLSCVRVKRLYLRREL